MYVVCIVYYTISFTRISYAVFVRAIHHTGIYAGHIHQHKHKHMSFFITRPPVVGRNTLNSNIVYIIRIDPIIEWTWLAFETENTHARTRTHAHTHTKYVKISVSSWITINANEFYGADEKKEIYTNSPNKDKLNARSMYKVPLMGSTWE